jgi:osmotically-inducible protein OsmY
MSTRRTRETYSRRSDNVGRRRSQEEYRGRRQARRSHGEESDVEQENEAGGFSGREEFDDDLFAGDEYERLPYQEERYGSREYGGGDYSQGSEGEEFQQQAQADQGARGSRRGGPRRHYGDRRDQSYGAQPGDRGYGRDPRRGSAVGGAGIGGYVEGAFGSGQRAFTGRGDFEQGGSMGGFRGRGPKGYRRSDERILEDVNETLADDDDLDASEIEVAVAEGEVTLSGLVSSCEAKRWAEDLADDVSGVVEVHNHLRVRRAGQVTDRAVGEQQTDGGGAASS